MRFFEWTTVALLNLLIFIAILITFTLIMEVVVFGSYTTLPLPEEGSDNERKEVEEGIKEWKWWEGESKKPMEKDGLMQFRGIDFYPQPDDYSEKSSKRSLEALLRIEEVNWVQLRFFLYQSDIDSVDVETRKEQDEILVEMIEKIHESGRKISLIPHLIVDEDRIWGGTIEPSDKSEWFSSYTEGLIHYAELAEESGVELFSIANEMVSLWGNEGWPEVLREVRKIYNGDVTVKLNSWYRQDYYERVINMRWLGDLDFIGIAPYFDITSEIGASKEQIMKGWRDSRHGLDIFKQLKSISRKYEKKMIFLEVGFRRTEGVTMEPWNYEDRVPRIDPEEAKSENREQIDATQVVFDLFAKEDWLAGTFWFYWPTRIIVNDDDTGWAIPGRKVEEVIWENFRKEWR